MENRVRKESRFSHCSTDSLQITLLWLYKDLMKNLFLSHLWCTLRSELLT